MRHNYLKDDPNSCSHWAIKNNTTGKVWVQLGDNEGNQIKLEFTTEQAEAMATHLFNMAHISTEQDKVSTSLKKHEHFLSDNYEDIQNNFTKAWEQKLSESENSILIEDENLSREQINERLNNIIANLSDEVNNVETLQHDDNL